MALVQLVGQLRRRLEGFAQCSDALEGKAKRGLSSEPIRFPNPGAGAFAHHFLQGQGIVLESISSSVPLTQHSSAIPLTFTSNAVPPFAQACPSPLPPPSPSHHQLSPGQLQRWTVFHCKPDHNVSPLKTLQRFFFPLGINLSSFPWPTVPTYLGP